MTTLNSSTILITGAGNGIGRAVSKACASAGATVILLDKQLPALESLYDEIVESGAPEPALYPMDLAGATVENYELMAQQLAENFDILEGIVHNAAALPYLSRIDDYDVSTWFEVMQVNLNAAFILTQSLLPLLRKAKQASIVFSTDKVGQQAKAYWGAYAVSKAGQIVLMQTLADELEGSSNIRANAVNPGPTRTALRLNVYPGEDATLLKQPEELTPLYLWLLGNESRETNGEVIDFDSWSE
jgi:NAD(P)-dependent dehydrogenase (short-subunit alcohol dehydrogenase family)